MTICHLVEVFCIYVLWILYDDAGLCNILQPCSVAGHVFSDFPDGPF